MSTNQNIDIVIKAIDDATATLKKVQGDVDELTRRVNSASKSTQNANAAMSNSFKWVTGAIKNALGAYVGFQSVKGLFTLTSQVEQAKIGFETLLWSQEKALNMLRDIDEFAAKTPFEKTNLTPLVQQLIGMGFEAQKALPIVQVLGDSMAALGRWQGDLNGVVLALGQIQTKGKVSAEELMQLAERGLPVFQILEQKLGLTKKQLENIGAVGISSAAWVNALLTWLNERFGGSMAKQSQTLAGQWSNLLDNVKSTVGNAGQIINDKVKGWISSVNRFFDENRPVIQAFLSNVLETIGGVTESIGITFAALGSVISDVLINVTGQTSSSAKNQMKSWQAVFMVVANGVNGLALLVSYAIRTVYTTAKIVAEAIKATTATIIGGIGMLLAAAMQPVEDMINSVIDGLNILRSAMGQTALAGVSFASNLGTKAASMIRDTWGEASDNVKEAWTQASDGMAADTERIVGNMVSNMERYQGTVDETSTKTSDLGSRIKTTLSDMAGSLGNLSLAHDKAKGSAAWQSKELKALKERAEDAIKPLIDKVKETRKEIEETTKKIKEKADEWKRYKVEALKALSDVNNEIVKLRKEAENINIKFNTEQNNRLAERYVSILKEQKDLQKEIDDTKAKDQNSDYYTDTSEQQKRIAELAKERQLIEMGVSKAALDSAVAYESMSVTEKIILDTQKQRNTELTENTAKMEAAIEKQRILEAQANQAKLWQVTVFSEYKNGMLTAYIETEKGKRQEIHDYENVALAADIAQKQSAYKSDYDTLQKTLSDKLSSQKKNILETSALYKQFNQFLKDDTKKTAEEMVLMIKSVSDQLREMISLRAQAGLWGAAVAGARAKGGPMDAGKPYLVGENGPEVVIPKQSATVIPNSGLTGNSTPINISININGGNYTGQQDQQTLAKVVGQELTRQLQLYKMGIS